MLTTIRLRRVGALRQIVRFWQDQHHGIIGLRRICAGPLEALDPEIFGQVETAFFSESFFNDLRIAAQEPGSIGFIMPGARQDRRHACVFSFDVIVAGFPLSFWCVRHRSVVFLGLDCQPCVAGIEFRDSFFHL